MSNLKIVSSLLILLFFSQLQANNALSPWPLLSKYKESDCLILDEKKANLKPEAFIRTQTIYAKFFVTNSVGRVLVNPEINTSRSAVTFSIETAERSKNEVTNHYCYFQIDLVIKAEQDQYEKLYIVVDKSVIYEIKIVDGALMSNITPTFQSLNEQ